MSDWWCKEHERMSERCLECLHRKVAEVEKELSQLIQVAKEVPDKMGCENSAMCEFTCGCEICNLHDALKKYAGQKE